MPSTTVQAEFASARRAMVDNQIRTYDVTDQRVLLAFETVPRENFLTATLADLAYSDAILTVEGSSLRRPMLVPMVLARMVQGLDLGPTDKTLVVGAGRGYAAAIVAELCGQVVALESDAGFAASTPSGAGAAKMTFVTAPLDKGWPALAPYDAILVVGGIEENYEGLLGQLASGGRLVAIHTSSHEATRRSGKVVRHDKHDIDVSSRVVFDASAPVLEEFRQKPAFVF